MPLSRMPLLRYRPCLPSVSSSYLFPHHRSSSGLIPKRTCLRTYLRFLSLYHLPIRSPTRILPSPLLLTPPHSPLSSTRASLLTSFIYYLHTVIGPLFNSPLPAHLSSDLFLPQLISPPTHLFFNSPLLQPTSSSTHLSSNSPKTYLRYRDH